jgi:hypothetical protein
VDSAEDPAFTNKRTATCEVAYMLGIVMVGILADFQTAHFIEGFKWQHNCRVCCALPNTSDLKVSVAEKEIQPAKYATAQITFILYIPL